MDSSASKNSSDPSDEEESDPHLWESILRAPIINIEISRQYERVLSTHIFYLDFMYSIHHVSISENHLYLSIYLFICGALSIGPIVRRNYSLSLPHTNTALYTHTRTHRHYFDFNWYRDFWDLRNFILHDETGPRRGNIWVSLLLVARPNMLCGGGRLGRGGIWEKLRAHPITIWKRFTYRPRETRQRRDVTVRSSVRSLINIGRWWWLCENLSPECAIEITDAAIACVGYMHWMRVREKVRIRLIRIRCRWLHCIGWWWRLRKPAT